MNEVDHLVQLAKDAQRDRAQLTDLVREVTRLQDRISEALRIHRNRASSIYRHGICVECSKGAVRGSVEYPCQTAQALGVTEAWLDEAR